MSSPTSRSIPTKDKRVVAGFYGIAPIPLDGSIWGSVLGFPGMVVRLDPGDNPPNTALSEVYEVPLMPARLLAARHGHRHATASSGCRSRAATWRASTAASARARSTARPRPASIVRKAGRSIRCPARSSADVEAETGSAEASYYTWVDQHDTFGLGKDVPIATGNNSDSLHALVDGKFVPLRVPYPMGFYAKGLDGRIDDPNAGWKGRGLWSTYGNRTPFHIEGGKGTDPRW